MKQLRKSIDTNNKKKSLRHWIGKYQNMIVKQSISEGINPQLQPIMFLNSHESPYRGIECQHLTRL